MKSLGLSACLLSIVLAVGPAQALSCLRPNIARTFNDLSDSDRAYVMALGQLEQTGKRIPKRSKPETTGGAEQPVLDIGIPHEVPARFTGQTFGLAGLSPTQVLDVVVDEICLASWCGSFPATTDPMLVFVEQTDAGYRLRAGPCGGDFKIAPTSQELDLLQSCLQAGHCSADQITVLEDRPN